MSVDPRRAHCPLLLSIAIPFYRDGLVVYHYCYQVSVLGRIHLSILFRRGDGLQNVPYQACHGDQYKGVRTHLTYLSRPAKPPFAFLPSH